MENRLDYTKWLANLKQCIQSAQQRAALSVNRGLVLLYLHIGREILERQQNVGWGAKVIDQLAKDLTAGFLDMKGFSRRNLLYMSSFAESWPDRLIVQEVVAQLGVARSVVNKIVNSPNLSSCWSLV